MCVKYVFAYSLQWERNERRQTTFSVSRGVLPVYLLCSKLLLYYILFVRITFRFDRCAVFGVWRRHPIVTTPPRAFVSYCRSNRLLLLLLLLLRCITVFKSSRFGCRIIIILYHDGYHCVQKHKRHSSTIRLSVFSLLVGILLQLLRLLRLYYTLVNG